jgi:hypothetical protein
MRTKMKTLNEPALAFVDFNGGHAKMISRDDVSGADLPPTILDALARDLGDQSVRVPGHQGFHLNGGVTDAAYGWLDGFAQEVAWVSVGRGERKEF